MSWECPEKNCGSSFIFDAHMNMWHHTNMADPFTLVLPMSAVRIYLEGYVCPLFLGTHIHNSLTCPCERVFHFK